MSSEENLQTLTKVTDGEQPCITPYGGDYGKDLFFAVVENNSAMSNFNIYNIYKKDNAFSSAMSQKTSGKNYNFSPAYCAQNDKIVFRCQNEGNATSDIFTISNAKGKALTKITESSNAFENHPSFSPDGRFIIYDKQSLALGNSNLNFILGITGIQYSIIEKSEIWLKNVETGETILLGNGYQPAFSPDGKTIAYVKYSSETKTCNIWTMSLDGDNQVQITDAKKGFAFYPQWSPDGQYIVFQSSTKDKPDADIYYIGVDGNNLTQITMNKSHDGSPYWTKDNYIYFVSDRGGKKGNYQIWRFKM